MNILAQRNKSRPARVIVALLALILLGALVVTGCSTTSQGATSIGLNVGNLAPDFTLTDLDGNQVTLSDFRGKAVFINFWATWCPPCRAEMPEIEAVYQAYKDRDVVVIGVDLNESVNEVRQYVEEGGYSWIFVIDTGLVSRNYRVTAIPTSFFLDKEGIIRDVSIGAMSRVTMASKLAKAL